MKQKRIFLVVSMLAASNLVNGWSQSLPSVNSKPNAPAVKEGQGFPKVVDAILKSGDKDTIGANLAPQIGLESAAPTKSTEIIPKDTKKPTRFCHVVLKSEDDTKSPICAFIGSSVKEGNQKQTRYFRVGLSGKLEKSVLVHGRLDESGKIIRGSASKTDEDINSPEVKKAFDAEMSYWLKDWLKKQGKAGKKA